MATKTQEQNTQLTKMASKAVKELEAILKSERKPATVPLGRVDINVENIRQRIMNNDADGFGRGITELAESIEAIGLREPMLLVKDGERFTIVDGNRRALALHMLREAKKITDDFPIKAEIAEYDDVKRGSLVDQAVRNMSRVDLSNSDKAKTMARLYAAMPGSEGEKISAINKLTGYSDQYIAHLAAVAVLPKELLDYWDSGKAGVDLNFLYSIAKNKARAKLAAEAVKQIQEGKRPKVGGDDSGEESRGQDRPGPKRFTDESIRGVWKMISEMPFSDGEKAMANFLLHWVETGDAEPAELDLKKLIKHVSPRKAVKWIAAQKKAAEQVSEDETE